MTINLGTTLIFAALISSLTLAANRGSRLVPLIALVACALSALIAFGLMQLSVARFRIDIILPAVILITGGILWSRSATKSTITAATILTITGLIQLSQGLRLLA